MHRLDAHRTWLLYVGIVALARTTGWTLAAVYFVQEVGMGPLELVLAGTALELAYFLFEVPTGIVADVYSRRTSVIVGQVIMGAGLLLTGAVAEVGVVLAAAALIGFGWTFRSGAEDAWLADEVGPERMARSFQRGAQVERVASLAGIGLAVALGVVDLRLPLIAAGLLLLGLAVVLAFVMPETGFQPANGEELGAARSFARTASEGGRLVRARPVLGLIVAITFFGGMWSEAMDRLWEAHFLLDVGLPSLGGLDPIAWFGVLAAGSLLLAVIVAQPLVPHFERLGREGMARLLLALDATLIAGTSPSPSQAISRWRSPPSGRSTSPARSPTRSTTPG